MGARKRLRLELEVPPLGHRAATATLWLARGLSIVFLLILVVMSVAEDPYAVPPGERSRDERIRNYAGLALGFYLPGLGMLLGWRWQRLGGLIAVGSLAAHHIVMSILMRGVTDPIARSTLSLSGLAWRMAVASPGLLFLILSFSNPTPAKGGQ